MLPTNLNTNEVKDSAGAEQEFTRHSTLGTAVIFKDAAEAPNLQHRLTVSHKEIGDGSARRRRSVVRFDLDVDTDTTVATDAVKPAKISAYTVVDIPVGALNDYTDVTSLVANLISFLATTGSGTTVLFDGTGHGSSALINGTL